MFATETEFYANMPKTIATSEEIYEVPIPPEQVKNTGNKDTNVRRGLITLAIFLSLILVLVTVGIVIIMQLQNEMKIVKEQIIDQGNQSLGQMKFLEKKLESGYNNSVSELKDIMTNDSKVFNLKLQQQQLQIDQALDEISRLNVSFSLLARITQAFPEACTKVIQSYAKIQNTTGGVFDIYPESRDKPFEVYCDLETDGGGWIVFQRRMNGIEDFYRGWNDYVNGFGEKDKEMWLGLETIYQLTKDGNYELRVDLKNVSGDSAYAKYETFSIASASDNYCLKVGGYSGTAGDSMTYSNGM
ncbi:tenascin-R-like isoform X1 [Styela clava]